MLLSSLYNEYFLRLVKVLYVLPSGSMKKNILVVEDSAFVGELIVFSLRNQGYRLKLVKDGEEALVMAKSRLFDLVLTDINMPNMDGLSMIRALRNLKGYTDIPMLVITVESDRRLKLQAKMVGATGWLVKPFDPKTLLNTVDSVLNLE
jgi:two-component system, chemotaxis family, chemotaxis protein CheY